MVMTTPRSAPARPWGCILLLLAALLLVRGAWLTWPEQSTKEWSRPVGMHALAFDPHGALVVQVDSTLMWYDPTTQDLATGTPMATLQADGDITSFAISPDGQWVATGTTSGTLTLWTEAPNWRMVERLTFVPPAGGERSVRAISFSADGHSVCWVASSYTNDWVQTISIRVWDRITRQDRFTFTQTVKGERAYFDYGVGYLSPDSQQIVLIGTRLELRRVDDNRLVYPFVRISGSEYIGSVAISPDQQWLASGGQGQVIIRRFSDGAVVQVLKGRESGSYQVAFSPDSRYLAIGGSTTSGSGLLIGAPFSSPAWEPVTLWRVANWQRIQTFQGHRDGANAIVFSPDGQFIATYGSRVADLTIRIWRVAPHNPFEPFFWLGGGLALLLVAVGRWIWQRRRARA